MRHHAVFQVGDKIRDYEIVARLKAGGMATLFLGRRRGVAGFARHVAIKVVHPHLSDDSTFVEMFLDEARLSSQIHHPNVVHVEELGQIDGSYFLVMEYVRGVSLAQFIRALANRQRRMSPELATYIAIELAEGLHAAHEATDEDGELLQVVHRDVSPQNVLLAYKGNVKLIDFGIAKAQGRAQQTTARSLKGKLRYMAPEQAWGEDVDRRTDLYALGIILWEMLTMRRLFTGVDDFALLEEVRNPHAVPPSSISDGIPELLDEVVLRTLSKDPKERPSTARELRTDLVRAMPSAVALDAANLADLLRVVMADDIERDKAVLPESVSRVLDGVDPEDRTRTAPPDKETLETMTREGVDSDLGKRDGDDGIDIEVVGEERRRPRNARRLAASVVVALAAIGAAVAAGRYSVGADPDDATASVVEPAATPAERASMVEPEIATAAAPPPHLGATARAIDAGARDASGASTEVAVRRERAGGERTHMRRTPRTTEADMAETETTEIEEARTDVRMVGMSQIIVGIGDAPF